MLRSIFVAILAVFSFSGFLFADIESVKVAEYNFNGNAVNSRTGLNGEEFGTWHYHDLGLKGTALYLDNTTSTPAKQSYVNLHEFDPNSSGTADEMSFSFWVKPKTTSGNHCYIGKHTSSGGNVLLFGRYSTGKLTIQIKDVWTYFTDTEKANEWTHYAVTTKKVINQTQTEVKVYKNGAFLFTTTLNDVLGNITGRPWVVGQEWDTNTPSDFTNGVFDELSFYNRVLTAAEITDLYSEQNDQNVYQGRYVSYSFDNNTNISTYGNSITNVGTTEGTIAYQAGHIGSSINLSGSGFVNLAEFNPVAAGTADEFSIELRVKPTATTGDHCYIGKHNTSGGNIFLFGFFSGGAYVNINGANYKYTMAEPFGVWTHWVVVGKKVPSVNQTAISVYQDGVLLYNTTLSSALGTITGKPWVLGMDWDSSTSKTDFTVGEFDEVVFYSRALTASEVASRAQYPKLDDKLLAHYTFDGNFDSKVKEYGYYPAQASGAADPSARLTPTNAVDGYAATFPGLTGGVQQYLTAGTDNHDIGASELHDPRLFYSGTENRGWAVSFWINPDSNEYTPTYFARNLVNGTNDYFMLRGTQPNYYLRVYKGNSYFTLPAGAGESTGWQHYVINYLINGSNTQVYVYKNGEYKHAGTITGAYSSITNATTHKPWTFGAEWNVSGENIYPSNLFLGKMDNIRFYGRTLNSAEVNTLYNKCEMEHSHKNSSGTCVCDYGYQINAEGTACEKNSGISGVVGGSNLLTYYPFTTSNTITSGSLSGSVFYESENPVYDDDTRTPGSCFQDNNVYYLHITYRHPYDLYVSGSISSSFTCEFNGEACLATSADRYVWVSDMSRTETYAFGSSESACNDCRTDQEDCNSPISTSYLSADVKDIETSNTFTMGFWMKPSNPDFNITMYRDEQYSGDTTDMISLNIFNTSTRKEAELTVYNPQSGESISKKFPLEFVDTPRNQNSGWHYYSLVFNPDGSNGVYLYVNGIKQDNQPLRLLTGTIGFAQANNNRFYMNVNGGGIDELVLYNRALSDGEINDHYFGFICPAGEKQSGADCIDACGDGIIDPGEQCDDGNAVDTDACTNSCLPNICGDGSVYTGVEECDDGNYSNNDNCLNNCTNYECGDGYLNSGVETCESTDTISCTDALGVSSTGTAPCNSLCNGWVTSGNCTKTFQCTEKPEPGTVYNTEYSYSQTWNGSAWSPADDSTTEYNATASTTSCRYKCDANNNYVYDSTLSGPNYCRKCGDNIRAGIEICDGTDLNSQTCSSQVTGATGGTLSCAGCSSFVTTACIKENQACAGLPSNASWNTASSITQTWNGTAWTPTLTGLYNTTSSTTDCRFICNTNYTWNSGSSTCVADTQPFTCSAKPTNTDWNTVSGYTQTWSGTAWLPADSTTSYNTTASTTECRYKCSADYHREGSACVSNTRTDQACTGLESNTEWNTASTITQTWNGTAWTPTLVGEYNTTASTTECRYKCSSDYHRDGGTCISNTRTNQTCTGLPSNASWNTVSAITQTWSDTEWLPTTAGVHNNSSAGSEDDCWFKCNSGYEWDENTGTCIDIDECEESTYDCPDHSICVNVEGSYDCECIDGYDPTESSPITCIPDCGDGKWVSGEECDWELDFTTNCRNISSDYKSGDAPCGTTCTWDDSGCEHVCENTTCGLTWSATAGGSDTIINCLADGTCGSGITCSSTGSEPSVECICPAGYHLEAVHFASMNIPHKICVSDTKKVQCPALDMPQYAEWSDQVDSSGVATLTWDESNQNYGVKQPDDSFITLEEACDWSCAEGFVEDPSQGLHFTHADFGLSWDDQKERPLYGQMVPFFDRLHSMGDVTNPDFTYKIVFDALNSDIQSRLQDTYVCDDNDPVDAVCADMTDRVMAALTMAAIQNVPLITYNKTTLEFSASDAGTILTAETLELIQNLPDTIIVLPGNIHTGVALANRRVIEDALNHNLSTKIRKGYNTGERMCVSRRIDNCVKDTTGILDFKEVVKGSTTYIMPESYYYIYSENLVRPVVSTYVNGEWNVPQCPWSCKPGAQISVASSTHCEPVDQVTIPDANLKICANRSIAEMKNSTKFGYAKWLKETCAKNSSALPSGICTVVNGIYDLEAIINAILPTPYELVLVTPPEEDDPVYLADAQLVKDMDCSYATLNEGDFTGLDDRSTYITNLEGIQYFISLENLSLDGQAVSTLEPLGAIPSTGYIEEPKSLLFGPFNPASYLENIEESVQDAIITVRKFEIVPDLEGCGSGYRQVTDTILEQHLFNNGSWGRVEDQYIENTASLIYKQDSPHEQWLGGACLKEPYLADGTYELGSIRVQNCSAGSGRGMMIETETTTSKRAVMMCEGDGKLPYGRVRPTLESSSLWPLRWIMVAELGLVRTDTMLDKPLGNFWFDTNPSYREDFIVPYYTAELVTDRGECGSSERAYLIKFYGDVFDMLNAVQITDLDSATIEIEIPETKEIAICADAATGELPNILLQQNNFTTYALRISTPKIRGLKSLNIANNTHNHINIQDEWITQLADITPLIFHPRLEYLSLEGTPALSVTSPSTYEVVQRNLAPLVHNHSMKWLNLGGNMLQTSSWDESDDPLLNETIGEEYFNQNPTLSYRTGDLRSLCNMTKLRAFMAPYSDIRYFNQRLDTVHRQCSCGDIKNYRMPKDIEIKPAKDNVEVPSVRYLFRKTLGDDQTEVAFEVPYPLGYPCRCNPCKKIEEQISKLWEDRGCDDSSAPCSFELEDSESLPSNYYYYNSYEIREIIGTCYVETDQSRDFSSLKLTQPSEIPAYFKLCSNQDACELTRQTPLFRRMEFEEAEYTFDFSPEYNPAVSGDMDLTYKIELKYNLDLFNAMMPDPATNNVEVRIEYLFNGVSYSDNIFISVSGLTEDTVTHNVTRELSSLTSVNTMQKDLHIKVSNINSENSIYIPSFIKSIKIKDMELKIGNGTQCEVNMVKVTEELDEDTCGCNVYTGKCDGKKWYPGTLAEQWSDLEYLDLSGNPLVNQTFLIQHEDSRMGNIETTCSSASNTVFVGKYDGISYFNKLKGLFLRNVKDIYDSNEASAYNSADVSGGCDVSQDRLAGLIPLLPELEYVDISGTMSDYSGTIPDMPDFNNSRLKELDISGNLITSKEDMTASLSKQHNLEYLDLSTIRFPLSSPGDKLQYIEFIYGMQNLQYLDLSDNHIYGYFDDLPMNHFPRLEYLDFSSNLVFQLDWLVVMPEIRYLNIAGNKTQEIEQVSHLQNLEELNITGHCIVDSNGVADTSRIAAAVDSSIQLTGASDEGEGCTHIGLITVCNNGIREGAEVCDSEFKLCRHISGHETEAGYAYCNNDCDGWDFSDCEETDEDFPEDTDEEIPDIDTDLTCNNGRIMVASNGHPFCLCNEGYHMQGDRCVRDSVQSLPVSTAEEVLDSAGSLGSGENDMTHIGNLKEDPEYPDEVPDDDSIPIGELTTLYNCSYPTVENCFSESYQRDQCGILYRGVCKDMMNFCMPIGGRCCIPEKDKEGNLLNVCKPKSVNICNQYNVPSGPEMCSRKNTNDYLGCHFEGTYGSGACGAYISTCAADITEVPCNTNADCGCTKGDEQCLYQCQDVTVAGLIERRCVGVACDGGTALIFDESQCSIVENDGPTKQICVSKDLAEQISLIGNDEESCQGYPEIITLEFDEDNVLRKKVSCLLPSPMLKFSNECDHSFVGCLNNIQARVHNLFRFNTAKLKDAGDSYSSLRCGDLVTESDKAFCGAFSRTGLGSEDLFEDETSTWVETDICYIRFLSGIYGTNPNLVIEASECESSQQ